MTPVFLAFAFLFTVESQPPELPQVRYPEWEQKDDIRRRVDAQLTLQMEITADGAISRVTLVAQENIPAERLDKTIESFKRQLEGGRAKPALRDGRAIACTYKHIFVWPLFVPPPEQHRYPGDEPRRPMGKEGGGAPEAAVRLRETENRSYVDAPDGREIPLETFKAELDARAKGLMNPAALRQRKDGPMLLWTDEASAEQITFTTNILRTLPVTFSALFKTVLPPRPALPEFTVYFFHSPDALAQFQKALGVPRWADGSYMGALKILAASIPSGNPFHTRELLIHEETHFLVRELLIPKAACPVWLNEGLAEVFAGSRINPAGRMTFSAMDAGEYLDKRAGKIWMSRSEIHRRLLVEEYSVLRGNALKRLLAGAMDPREDTSEADIRRFYACAWGFTRFLVGDEKTAVRREFLDLITALNEGRDAPSVLLAAYGSYEDMEKKFWKTVHKW